ncbi:FAD-binding protein [Aeriscardovia aeriphila]|uniref:UDP-N-acetylenolpyruvoylglucosamine reductase n=1 Tax=Aeriscardovia aeriphila TaxID=218139 RepID=A0A261F9M1_9BIFI|nr:FAD-binding protein [Aeriscardovia aeriphila]NYI26074.1 UDP-N-acetylmuramate dehydrogenase [Aeriscardovia aeriphila]OZG55778.1 UDP-N-acetylenolpyruvoylglucosamine reductase [Aeriscardovia aeriphila]
MSVSPRFADITTIGVGGAIAHFVEAHSRDEFINAVCFADDEKLPLLVIGGGSNLLISDENFPGVVVRDARHAIHVLGSDSGDANSDSHAAPALTIRADAGVRWDAFVAFAVSHGLSGIEALSGIPGTVGASVVQNIGAYGQEVSTSVKEVEVWDRKTTSTKHLTASEMGFGYRMSALKESMYTAPAQPADRYFPTPRYIVLSVTFTLSCQSYGVVNYSQLARALNSEVGVHMPIEQMRRMVLRVRAGKGMVEDATRYKNQWMRTLLQPIDVDDADNLLASFKLSAQDYQSANSPAAPQKTGVVSESAGRESAVGEAREGAGREGALADVKLEDVDEQLVVSGIPSSVEISGQPTYDRHSCGSFFMNPILSVEDAEKLPEDAPHFAASMPGTEEEGVKTSAAWLIDHAGFHKGFTGTAPQASLSTLHTLALTNRGEASSEDVRSLARIIQEGVQKRFGIWLVPEPVCVGVDLAQD